MTLDRWLASRARVITKKTRRVRLDDKVALFQQLATLVGSGTPIMQALQICAQQSGSRDLQKVLEHVAVAVSSGSSLQEAMADHPKIFEPHWLGLIRSGEMSGGLADVLLDLSRQLAEYRNTRRKLVGSMIYPLTIVVVAVGAIVIMLTCVIPTFTNMFSEMGAELPSITKFVLSASNGAIEYGPFIIVALGILAWGLRRLLKTESGLRAVTALGFLNPVTATLMVNFAMYRFAAQAGLLLKGGVAMLDMLDGIEGVFYRNPIYRDALRVVKRRVASGRSLADALEQTELFTGLVVNMIRTGEESGCLAPIMEQLAPYYREKAEASMTAATKVIEPTIIVLMGTAIAALMLSIYLPMFEMAGNVH